MSGVILSVSYPALSKIQDDECRLIEAYKKIARLSAFIIFPLMIGLSSLAEPIIMLLLGEKWQGMIILLQILCFSYVWDTFNACNMNLLQLKGHSGFYLKLEIIKKIVGIAVLIVTLPMGIKAMCLGKVILSLIYIPINTYYSGRLFSYGMFAQLRDLMPVFLHAAIMGGIIYVCVGLFPSLWLKLILGCIIGVVYYIGVAYCFKLPELKELYSLCVNFILRNK